VVSRFSLSATGSLVFGPKELSNLPRLVSLRGFSHLALVVSPSFQRSPEASSLFLQLQAMGISTSLFPVSGEPTVEQVDALATTVAACPADAVVGIGGGSVLDTAKAVSVMAYQARFHGSVSVQRFLEGVGDLPPPGRRLPLIAVPTTAGTGSEATKNAVIARLGPQGFKKSLRHDAYVPDLVVIDPTLLVGLPRGVAAASGLDAVTQLLESYLSLNANPFTDALALDALGRAGKALALVLTTHAGDVGLWGDLSYGAYISGVIMASAGLGYVHSIAGPMGALHPVPHGVACGHLLAPVTKALVREMELNPKAHVVQFEKLDRLAGLWEVEGPQEVLVFLEELTAFAGLLPLARYGFTHAEIPSLVESAAQRSSPVALSKEILGGILSKLF